MRRFKLTRSDSAGCSQVTPTAEGVQFTDGAVAIRWYGPDFSTVSWQNFAAAERGWKRSCGEVELTWLDRP